MPTFRPAFLLEKNPHHEGVRRINVYLLRLLYGLMFFVLGRTTWAHVLSHRGAWEADDAMAWCVWTAFATLAGLGLLRPVKMLPILLLEIFYKVEWLFLVAYPLWSKGQLDTSPVAGQAAAFLWVLLPIVAVPWPHVLRTYVLTSPLPASTRRVPPPSGTPPTCSTPPAP